jgi:hypothetical protein
MKHETMKFTVQNTESDVKWRKATPMSGRLEPLGRECSEIYTKITIQYVPDVNTPHRDCMHSRAVSDRAYVSRLETLGFLIQLNLGERTLNARGIQHCILSNHRSDDWLITG